MPVIVQKFGGTSVGDPEKIRRVARIIADTHDKGYQVVTVVSAMGHSTDHLVDLAKQIAEYPSEPQYCREYDALLATGEMVTTALMAMALNQMGYDAVGFNGIQAGFQTNDVHNSAKVMHIDTRRLREALDSGKIVIVTGFQGLNDNGDITTLGRGGSDTSAVALAAALKAERCDIYTDVTGIYTTDPRVVPEAFKLDKIAYIEMMELARSGAQVLHPRAVEIAQHFQVPLVKRSTFDLEDPGTMVTGVEAIEAVRNVTGIACDETQVRLAVINVPDKPGVAAHFFGALAQHNVSVDMIIQSLSADNQTNTIAFTVHEDNLSQCMNVLNEIMPQHPGCSVVVDENIAKVSIVGAGMIDRPGIASDMFAALSDAGINIKMIATSEIKVSCLVDKAQSKDAVRAIHRKFFPQAQSPAGVMINEKVGY